MSNISLPRDNNRITVIGGVSSSDGATPITIYVDPTTHRVLVDATSGTSLTVGTTTIASGTTTRILYDNAGVLGEYTLSGSGTVVAMATSPSFTTPTLGVATATSINGLTITSTSGGTLTLANSSSLITSGGNSITLTSTGTTTVTLPTSGTLATLAGTETLTNKRITRRVVTTTQTATPTINTDNTDVSSITALAQAITSMTTNLSGTPNAGDLLEIQITDNGTARAITWGTSFQSTNTTLPTTTVISTMLRIGFEWNTVASKWDCIAVS